MSLKGFHIVFVTVCTLLFAFLSVWSFGFAPDDFTLAKPLGVVSLVSLALMPVYAVYFLRKLRRAHI